MSALKDLTGQKFGRLTVIERAENTRCGQARWKCRCQCGKEVIITGELLRNGVTSSCGCLRKERTAKTRKTHGLSNTLIYQIWASMIKRCTNPNINGYKNWGGRGIAVCERWFKFENFYTDVKDLPHCNEKGYELDRINNDLGYTLDNVRFVTPTEQVRNRRNTIRARYKGEEKPLAEIAEITGISYYTLKTRFYAGERDDRLVRPVETKCRNKN